MNVASALISAPIWLNARGHVKKYSAWSAFLKQRRYAIDAQIVAVSLFMGASYLPLSSSSYVPSTNSANNRYFL